MKTTVKFAKLRDDAIIPSKRDEDAAMDIYACFDEDYMVINPHQSALIPTGIASACETDYCIIAKERGSTGSKGIGLRCGVIDSGYRNEIFIVLTNTTDKILFISKLSESDTYLSYYNDIMPESFVYPYNKAIAQLMVVPVPEVAVEVISYDELCNIKSERMMGALGSSGK